jgi:hypothetical protein
VAVSGGRPGRNVVTEEIRIGTSLMATAGAADEHGLALRGAVDGSSD